MAQGASQVTDLRDVTAFRAFYEEMLPRVYSFVFHRCAGDAAAAEDVVQEAFLAGVEELRRARAIDDPRRWIFGLARHKLYDHYRRTMREERKLARIWRAPERPDEWADGFEVTQQGTFTTLAALPPSQRAVLTLRYLDDLPVPEIAAAIGRSVHATESLLARGRQSFRQAYEEAADV